VTDDGSVSYDYSYKLWSERDVTDVTADHSGQYKWTTTAWSLCNATCGTGTCSFIDP